MLQNSNNLPETQPVSIDPAPTEPIDMAILLAHDRSASTPSAGSEAPPHPPVAAVNHANLVSGDSPIAEWLDEVAPETDEPSTVWPFPEDPPTTRS